MELTLVPFDSELWEIYTGAYSDVRAEVKILMDHKRSSAEKVRHTASKKKGDCQIAFDNLCENLWKQTNCQSAAYLVMPYMVVLLEDMEKINHFHWQLEIICGMGLYLAAQPDMGRGVNVEPEGIFENYKRSIEILQEKTKSFLEKYMEDLKKLEENKRSEFLIALMAILGDRQAAFLMSMNAWEYCPFLCDHCGYGFENGSVGGAQLLERISPAGEKQWDGKSFDDVHSWYGYILRSLGAQEEAKRLSYYYGTFTCPECGEKLPVAELIKSRHSFV